MVFHGDFPAISADFPWSDCLTGELESGWWRGARPRQRRLALVRRSGERRRATLGARAPGFGDARVLRGFRHGKCPIYRWFTWVYLLKMVTFHRKNLGISLISPRKVVFFSARKPFGNFNWHRLISGWNPCESGIFSQSSRNFTNVFSDFFAKKTMVEFPYNENIMGMWWDKANKNGNVMQPTIMFFLGFPTVGDPKIIQMCQHDFRRGASI